MTNLQIQPSDMTAIQNALQTIFNRIDEGDSFDHACQLAGIVGDLRHALNAYLGVCRRCADETKLEFLLYIYYVKSRIAAVRGDILEMALAGASISGIEGKLYIAKGWLKRYLHYCDGRPEGSEDYLFLQDFHYNQSEHASSILETLSKEAQAGSPLAMMALARRADPSFDSRAGAEKEAAPAQDVTLRVTFDRLPPPTT